MKQFFMFKPGVVYTVWLFAQTSLGQLLVGSAKIICAYDAPALPLDISPNVIMMSEFIASLPNVQRGDAVPAAGIPFIDSSGFVVVSRPSSTVPNPTLKIFFSYLLAVLPSITVGGVEPSPGLGFFNSSDFLVIEQPSAAQSRPDLLPMMAKLVASLDVIPFNGTPPVAPAYYVNSSGFVVAVR